MENKHYGYCRVSTNYQEVSQQKYTLLDYANTHKFQFAKIIELVSSTRKTTKEREIDTLLSLACEYDHIYITKLDRLGRSTKEVLTTIDEIKNRKITLHIILDNIIVDPKHTDPITTMFLTLLSAFAEMERNFISSRVKTALANRKAQGVILGRKKGAISTKTQFEPFKEEIYQYLELELSLAKIVKKIGVGSKSSLYSWLKNREHLRAVT